MASHGESKQSFGINDVTDVRPVKTRTSYWCGFFSLFFGIGIGVVIGYFAICSHEQEVAGVFLKGVPDALIGDANEEISEKLRDELSGENIRKYLRSLADKPRVAGTSNTNEKSQYVFDFWTEHGADDVQMFPYNILLSKTSENDPSKVYIDDTNTAASVFVSHGLEWNRTAFGNRDDLLSPILGYTPAGNVTVKFAEKRGAKGIIIYSDPSNWNPSRDADYYPHTESLPPDGVQSGSTLIGTGDPQTPGYPSTDYAYRYPENSNKTPLPAIVAVPISSVDAEQILGAMSGDEVPMGWRGWLNVTYRFGPGLRNTAHKVRIRSTNYRHVTTINNVCATVRGNIEPDRYVIAGAHIDSWAYGGVDNAAGVATLMEMSRAVMSLVDKGVWRPRRSVVFCTWDGEEYGLIGSTELVEQYSQNLQHRTVAVINIDCPVVGNARPSAMGNPQLYKVIYESAKKVRNPFRPERIEEKRFTLFDSLLKHRPPKPNSTEEELGLFSIRKALGGTDYAPFVSSIGIPAVSFRFSMAESNQSFYSTYHTAFDTSEIIEKFIDPSFELHTTIAHVQVEVIRRLADSLVLPLDVRDYAGQLREYYDRLNKFCYEMMRNHSVPVENIDNAITDFAVTSENFMAMVMKLNRFNPIKIREINDQLMLFERSFIDGFGLPGRPYIRHVLFSLPGKSVLGAEDFPGLADVMFEIGEDQERWEEVKEHVAAITHAIRAATSSLRNAMAPSGAN